MPTFANHINYCAGDSVCVCISPWRTIDWLFPPDGKHVHDILGTGFIDSLIKSALSYIISSFHSVTQQGCTTMRHGSCAHLSANLYREIANGLPGWWSAPSICSTKSDPKKLASNVTNVGPPHHSSIVVPAAPWQVQNEPGDTVPLMQHGGYPDGHVTAPN